MRCPNCVGQMNLVNLKSHYRIPLVVDQCQKCGGIWFDRHEYYRATKENVHTLENVNLASLRSNVVIKTKLYCPRDAKLLIRFSDPNFPKNIDVERCDHCGGFFFNRGELAQFHLWKEEKKKTTLSKQYDMTMKARFEQEKEKSIYPMLEKVGDFLTTPYYGDHTQEQKKYVQIAIVIIQIINVLLNFFIRKRFPGVQFPNLVIGH